MSIDGVYPRSPNRARCSRTHRISGKDYEIALLGRLRQGVTKSASKQRGQERLTRSPCGVASSTMARRSMCSPARRCHCGHGLTAWEMGATDTREMGATDTRVCSSRVRAGGGVTSTGGREPFARHTVGRVSPEGARTRKKQRRVSVVPEMRVRPRRHGHAKNRRACVAVGTGLAARPPHGSRRAGLPHRALASDDDAQAMLPPAVSSPTRFASQGGSGSDRLVSLERILLGQAPSLDPLRRRRRGAALVRGLLRYYGPVRLPVAVHSRRARCGFTARTPAPAVADDGISQFLRQELPSMHGVSDLAGSSRLWLGIETVGVAFRAPRTASAPGSGVFRGSIPGLLVPLSTLHPRPRGRRRMTRGRCGLLGLHRTALSSAAPGQLSGAFPWHPKPVSVVPGTVSVAPGQGDWLVVARPGQRRLRCGGIRFSR